MKFRGLSKLKYPPSEGWRVLTERKEVTRVTHSGVKERDESADVMSSMSRGIVILFTPLITQ